MKRIGEAWFEFGGVRSDAMGLRMAKMPERRAAERRGEWARVPGRSGAIWLDGGAYEDLRIDVECVSADGFDAQTVRAWLQGAGMLVLSDEEDRAYRARAIEVRFEDVRDGYDGKRMTAAFACVPFRYEYPESGSVVMTAAGMVLNPGTAESEPRIKVAATGDFTLTVNGCFLEITGGSVIIDSELRDCLSEDGRGLANSRVRLNEFPVLRPGENNVSWTGNVTAVEIERRVRYL